jgi:sugar/nucleoside kinase (ribokinase family)
VAVIGELNVDLVASGLSLFPKLGAEILATDFTLTLGSASAIFASGLSKLECDVTFISQIGNDDFGRFCLEELSAAGVNVTRVKRDEKLKTGVTIALSMRGGDRALVTYLGSISSLRYEDIDLKLLSDHQHLHLTSYFLQTNLRPHFPEIFRAAREAGLTTSFDPNSDPECKWDESIWKVLAETDVLFLNEEEALALTRRNDVQEASPILGQRVPCAVVKLGAQGAMAISGQRIFTAPGFTVEALDTTGAGDSFASGFIAGYLRGLPVEDCLLMGNACGALSTLKAGGTPGQPSLESLQSFLQSRGLPMTGGKNNG